MNGLFGNCGCGCNRGFGGKLFGNRKQCGCDCNDCNDCCDKGCGFDCCSIILILLLLTCCCGCDIDWCNIIVLYLLLSCCM